jgi:MYXO-CTERM domain-containing protein
MRWLLLTCLLVASSSLARAITRDEVMVRALAYANHPWRCKTQNLTASCSSSYASEYIPGDYVGLPYDWGGYKTLFQFDQQIAKGDGAGSKPYGSVLSCTTGVDCSGYVSKCWNAGHTTTSSMSSISTGIATSQLLAGDALNKAGSHVVLYSHKLASGTPVFYEAGVHNVTVSHAGWSSVSGFVPIRYNKIQGTSAGKPAGTHLAPIVVSSFPYSDSRDTKLSTSSVLDGCGAAPTKSESGPEVIYTVKIIKPGTLTASVSDGPGVDVDVHIYTSMNTSDCVARDDKTVSHQVDCGTYYVVADTFGSSANAGPYTLTLAFTPSGTSCGNGPPTYNPKGKLGDACANPNNKNLPFCNENLGGQICIYTSSSSFCSKACTSSTECQQAFPGGCCQDVSGKGEYFCLVSSLCGGAPPVGDSSVPLKNDTGVPVAGDVGVTPTGDSGGGASDGGLPQAATEAGPGNNNGNNAGSGEGEGGGGGCSLSTRPTSHLPGLVLVLALGVLALTRRRRTAI